MAQDQDKKAGKTTPRTRLNNEIAYRYGANTGGRQTRRKPGQSSLTEDLATDADPQLEETTEAQGTEAGVAEPQAADAIAAEPRKSLFELPRKEPARPSLLPDVPAPASPSSSPDDAAPATSKRRG